MGHGTDPGPYGDDCLECFDVGKTPLILFDSFEGIETCNGDIGNVNRIFELEQDAHTPCLWEYTIGGILSQWHADNAGLSILIQSNGADKIFEDVIANTCIHAFTNELNCADPNVVSHKGAGIVMWNTGTTDGSIGSLLNAINMEPEPETKFHFIPASEGRACVRFARKKDATNILILVEPTEL